MNPKDISYEDMMKIMVNQKCLYVRIFFEYYAYANQCSSIAANTVTVLNDIATELYYSEDNDKLNKLRELFTADKITDLLNHNDKFSIFRECANATFEDIFKFYKMVEEEVLPEENTTEDDLSFSKTGIEFKGYPKVDQERKDQCEKFLKDIKEIEETNPPPVTGRLY